MGLKITGMDACLTKLDSLNTGMVHGPIAGALRYVAGEMNGTAKGLCPVRTGNLRNSIQMIDNSQTGGSVSFQVIAGASYAIYVEYGTGASGAESTSGHQYNVGYTTDLRGHKAQPFMHPAFSAHVGKIGPAILEAIKGAFK